MSEPTPEPTTTRTESGTSSRDRLLDVAATLFHEEGYHHVSMERILRESGVVRSNFYYHFRSKEDLAVAVIDTWLEDLQSRIITPALADESLAPLARVRAILIGLVDELEVTGCRGGCPFGSLANSEAEHNERFRRKLVETFDGFVALLDSLFAEAIASGALPGTLATDRLAACTLAVVQGSYLLAKTYAGVTPMRLAAEGLLEALEASARAAPESSESGL